MEQLLNHTQSQQKPTNRNSSINIYLIVSFLSFEAMLNMFSEFNQT
jgi:hypothetical protein